MQAFLAQAFAYYLAFAAAASFVLVVYCYLTFAYKVVKKALLLAGTFDGPSW